MAAVSSLNDRADGSRVRNVLGSGLCWRYKQLARENVSLPGPNSLVT